MTLHGQLYRSDNVPPRSLYSDLREGGRTERGKAEL
jgi:hypothetical protein